MSKGFTEEIDMVSLGALVTDIEAIVDEEIPVFDSKEINNFYTVLN